jgi:hypothetical protein
MFPDKIGVELVSPGFLRPRQLAPLNAAEEDP